MPVTGCGLRGISPLITGGFSLYWRRIWKAWCEPIEVVCRGFSCKPLWQGLWATWDLKGYKKESNRVCHGGLPDGFESGGMVCGPVLLEHKPGLDQPWLAWLSEVTWCWKTPNIQHWICVPVHYGMYLWLGVCNAPSVHASKCSCAKKEHKDKWAQRNVNGKHLIRHRF